MRDRARVLDPGDDHTAEAGGGGQREQADADARPERPGPPLASAGGLVRRREAARDDGRDADERDDRGQEEDEVQRGASDDRRLRQPDLLGRDAEPA